VSRPAEAPEIEVFTQAHCANCRRVERFLRERGVAFTVRDVGEDPEALEAITSRGYMSTPITRVGDRWVAGFNRRELERLI
jgi:glutaredoxin-like protein NrdH